MELSYQMVDPITCRDSRLPFRLIFCQITVEEAIVHQTTLPRQQKKQCATSLAPKTLGSLFLQDAARSLAQDGGRWRSSNPDGRRASSGTTSRRTHYTTAHVVRYWRGLAVPLRGASFRASSWLDPFPIRRRGFFCLPKRERDCAQWISLWQCSD